MFKITIPAYYDPGEDEEGDVWMRSEDTGEKKLEDLEIRATTFFNIDAVVKAKDDENRFTCSLIYAGGTSWLSPIDCGTILNKIMRLKRIGNAKVNPRRSNQKVLGGNRRKVSYAGLQGCRKDV